MATSSLQDEAGHHSSALFVQSVPYTLDGTTPGAQGGQTYTAPFTIEKNTTLVAMSFKEGLAPSPSTLATIWIGPPAHPRPRQMAVTTTAAMGAANRRSVLKSVI